MLRLKPFLISGLSYSKNALIRSQSPSTAVLRRFLSNSGGDNEDDRVKGGKYKIFKDEDAPVILDVEEERWKSDKDLTNVPRYVDEFEGLNLERGESGVFEIEDLVDVLKRENAEDICVIRVPPEYDYVNYIVICSGSSKRHIFGIIEFVKRVYKKKRNEWDIIPRIEGENASEWSAMDLGNIALHVMSPEARIKYDLDSLWAVGPAHDLHLKDPEDEIKDILSKHAVHLDEFEPANKLG